MSVRFGQEKRVRWLGLVLCYFALTIPKCVQAYDSFHTISFWHRNVLLHFTNISVLVWVKILIIEQFTSISLPITLNDDTDEDKSATNQLTSDVNGWRHCPDCFSVKWRSRMQLYTLTTWFFGLQFSLLFLFLKTVIRYDNYSTYKRQQYISKLLNVTNSPSWFWWKDRCVKNLQLIL